MFLKAIKFKENIVLDSKRESQSNFFKIKTRTYQVDDRRKPIPNTNNKRPWRPDQYEKKTVVEKTFTIFKKNLVIDFDYPITIIVGDNGCGKTTLIQNLIPPKIPGEMDRIISGRTIEEIYSERLKEWSDTTSRTLFFEKSPSYIIVEKDLHKAAMLKSGFSALTPNTTNGNTVTRLWDMAEFSNGENNLDLINRLKGIENALIVLDEPETSLSIKSQCKIVNLLKELSKTNQIIIITHSEYMMKLSNQVYDFEKKKYADTEKYILQQKLAN